MRRASLLLIFVLLAQIIFPQIASADCPKPIITVTPQSIDFGTVQVGGKSLPRTVTVTNEGDADLVITYISITGADTSQFFPDSVSTTNPVIPPGGSASGTIRFAPTSTGVKTARIRIYSNDHSHRCVSVHLTGTGTKGPPTEPDIYVSPTTVDFGAVEVGIPSAFENVTVTNEGDAALLVYDLSIDDGQFDIVSGNISGQSLLPGDSANITLVFTPAFTGLQSATLSIPSSDPDESTVNVTLNGTGTEGPPAPQPTSTGSSSSQTTTRYFTVDFLGKITQELATNDGRPIKNILAPSPDGLHQLEIAAYTAATDNTGGEVTRLVIRKAEAPGLPENTRLVGKAYEFRPSGTVFDRPVRLTLGYNVNDLPDRVRFVGAAYYSDKEGWKYLEVEATSLAELGKLTAPVFHFTVFAVLAEVAPEPPATEPAAPPATPKPEPKPEPKAPESGPSPALFKLSNLSITTSVSRYYDHISYIIRTGEEALITVDVTNTGGQPGSYAAILMVNGTERERKEVALEPGQTETVSFTITGNEPGTYTVVIGDLTGDFWSELWVNWWLIAGSGAILILIAWGIWYLVKRKRRAQI